MLVAREQTREEEIARRKRAGRQSTVSGVQDVAWLWQMSPRFKYLKQRDLRVKHHSRTFLVRRVRISLLSGNVR
jgi:hypothetical protein